MSDHDEKNQESAQFDDLLAGDQARLRKATEERIRSGMFVRIAEAQQQQNRWPVVSPWAIAGALAVIGLAVAVSLMREPPTRPSVVTNVPHETVTPAEAGSPKAPATQMTVKRPRPSPAVHPLTVTRPVNARNDIPRQPVFPANIAPTEQERLMMALARSDLTRKDPQLPEVAKNIAAQTEEEKGQRQAFEKWIQEGAAK